MIGCQGFISSYISFPFNACRNDQFGFGLRDSGLAKLKRKNVSEYGEIKIETTS